MVIALLAGRKTQTRRVYKPRYPSPYEVLEDGVPFQCGEDGVYHRRAEPYGVPGDRLWVKETFAFDESLDDMRPTDISSACCREYLADGEKVNVLRSYKRGKTRVSIHMPRWASRLTLEVTEVRVQRLQDISEEDALAEGIIEWSDGNDGTKYYGLTVADVWETSARGTYKRLWGDINGPESWVANPWVWAVSFRRVQP